MNSKSLEKFIHILNNLNESEFAHDSQKSHSLQKEVTFKIQ